MFDAFVTFLNEPPSFSFHVGFLVSCAVAVGVLLWLCGRRR